MLRAFTMIVVSTVLILGCTRTEPSAREVVTSTPAPTPTPTPTPEPVFDPIRTTVDELVDAPFPLNIARAGGELVAPQSTIFAFAEAVEAGAVVLELDVRLTADQVLVVHTDETVDATTDATGPVGELTLAEIQTLDNAYWFSPECWPCQDRPEDEYIHRGVRTGQRPPPEGYTPDDFRVATFREVVERFPRLPLAIEIGGTFPDGFAAAAALADEIEALELTDHVIVTSLDDAVLNAFELIAPEVETSPALDELTAWFLLDEPLDGAHRIVQVPPELDDVQVVTEQFWEQARADGLDVWVWADDPVQQDRQSFYQGLIAQGADGVIAGRPNEMAAALG